MAMVKIPNFLIVAIDTELRDYLTEKGVNVYYKDIQVRLALHPSMEMTLRRKESTYYTLCEPKNCDSTEHDATHSDSFQRCW